MNNNLVNLTDEELDDVAGGLPVWLPVVEYYLGSDARTVYENEGCYALRNYCVDQLGKDNHICLFIHC